MSGRMRPAALLAGLVALTGVTGSARAWAGPPSKDQLEAPRPGPAAIVGGQESATCAWPSVVALQGGGLCTGTLVHPRVVAYAAHCGTFHSKVYFGERIDAPSREVEVLRCERASDLFAVHTKDYAYCLLAEAVTDIAITPPLFGCDEDLIAIGTPVTIVGFGDTTTQDPEMVGVKHEAQTQVVSMLSTIGIGGMGVGADAGDSGGPAFVQLDDGSWRVLGLVSGGGGDGGTVQYVPAPLAIAWIEDRSGVDITPCHKGDASWAPTPSCEGFYVSTLAGASWAEGCPSERAGPSTDCGGAWTDLEDLDAPSVAFVAPLPGAQLPGAPLILTVEGEADDGEGVGVARLSLRVDGAAWPETDEVPPYRFENVVFDSDGEHLLELEAVDYFGNVAVAVATILVGEEAGTGEDTGTDTGTSEDTGTDTGESDGCHCSSTGREPAGLWTLLFALLWRRPNKNELF